MEIQTALEKFGLEKREIQIYLALLEYKSQSAYLLSKRTGILRQTIYDVLSSLSHKGLVSSVIKGRTKFFEAANPSRLKLILDEKNKAIQKILPELNKLGERIIEKPNVEFYEGIEGLKSVYNDIIKTKPLELLEYGNAENFLEILKLYFIENYIKKRINSKINLRLIVEKNKKTKIISKTNKKILRITKSLEEMKNLKTINYIYSDKFAILSLKKEPIAVIIKDKEIANAQKTLFEILWEIGDKY